MFILVKLLLFRNTLTHKEPPKVIAKANVIRVIKAIGRPSRHLLAKMKSVVLNAVARLLFSARKYDHVTPPLRELHWLRASERITFRLAVLVYRCLHGLQSSVTQYFVTWSWSFLTYVTTTEIHSLTNLSGAISLTRDGGSCPQTHVLPQCLCHTYTWPTVSVGPLTLCRRRRPYRFKNFR